MTREINFETARTLGDWLDFLSPARQVALLEMWPDSSRDSVFTAREVLECIFEYYNGAPGQQIIYILSDVFGWT